MAETREISAARRRWMLLAPALAILVFAASGPLLIVIMYSFLTPGDYGGVIWSFSTDAWFNVVAERDFFDETLSFSDAHWSIFWRSVKLSLMTTAVAFLVGFPTAYFIANPPKGDPRYLDAADHHPVLDQSPDPYFCGDGDHSERRRREQRSDRAGIIDEPIQLLFTEFAITLGMFYVYLPLMVLPIYASMERLDFSLVEAAYDLYASRWRVLKRVIFPLVKPGVIAGSILVFVPSLGAYVTPRVLGGGKQLMLGNLIELQFGQGRNWPLGAALSITLLAIVMIALMFYVRSAGREEVSHG